VENRVANGKQILTGTPKSKASNRVLPMPDEVVAVLKAAREQQSEERLAFGEGYGSGEYVASDETGQPYHPNLLTFRWGRMLDTLKIERVRLHDARHSCASLTHARHVPIATIAAWLGHTSAAFTMAVYTHSADEALKAAAVSFGRVVTTRDTETVHGINGSGFSQVDRCPHWDSNPDWADFKSAASANWAMGARRRI
jgi:integrase